MSYRHSDELQSAGTPEEIDNITEEAIELADALVEQLVSSSPRTTADTLLPLDEIGAALADSFGRGGFRRSSTQIRRCGRRVAGRRTAAEVGG